MGRDVFYITTPIYYPNDVPHIGHAYTTVAADFIARYHRLRGDEVFFLTGTDEHGLKLPQAPASRGPGRRRPAWTTMEPKWREVWARLDIAYDDYIRTTRAAPRGAPSRSSWRPSTTTARRHLPGDLRGRLLRLVRGLLHGRTNWSRADCARSTSTPVEHVVEENYFFRLSAYADRLLAHYEEDPSRHRARDPAQRGPER